MSEGWEGDRFIMAILGIILTVCLAILTPLIIIVFLFWVSIVLLISAWLRTLPGDKTVIAGPLMLYWVWYDTWRQVLSE